MGRIIRNGIEYGSGGTASNIAYLTQEAYDALPDDKLIDGVEYRITDANTDSTKARNIGYDNSESGIEAVSVQDAIDKVNYDLKNNLNSVSLLAYDSTDKTVTIPNINNYKMVYLCIMDTTNKVVLASDTLSIKLFKAFAESNYSNYVSFYSDSGTNAWATFKLETDTSIVCQLRYGNTYTAGRLQYRIYAIK